MIVKKISHVQMVAPKGDDDLAAKTRLRILLQLALTIGRREGLLSNGDGEKTPQTQLEQEVLQETGGNGHSKTQ